MASSYEQDRETVTELILEYGGAGQLILVGTTGGFDGSGDSTPDTPSTLIDGILTPIINYKNHEIDGESVIKGDGYILWQSATKLSELVVEKLQITINGTLFRVKDIGELTSINGVNLAYKLQLRK